MTLTYSISVEWLHEGRQQELMYPLAAEAVSAVALVSIECLLLESFLGPKVSMLPIFPFIGS